MNRILVPALPGVGGRVEAGAAESHHLLHVQRVARGSLVQVSDGKGQRAHARLVDVVAGRACLTIEERLPGTEAPRRVILLGLPKGPALEEALILGTEAGASAFLLVQAERSPPGGLRPDRLGRILRGAVTQCGRPDVPALDGPYPLPEALRHLDTPTRILAVPGGPPLVATASALTLAIGPEGGWSPAETESLLAAGFQAAALGPHVQRTPTAVAAALARAWLPIDREG